MTDSIGQMILGGVLPWGRWLTIHSAGWGILCNIVVCVIVSALTQDSKQRAHRLKFHVFCGNIPDCRLRSANRYRSLGA